MNGMKINILIVDDSQKDIELLTQVIQSASVYFPDYDISTTSVTNPLDPLVKGDFQIRIFDLNLGEEIGNGYNQARKFSNSANFLMSGNLDTSILSSKVMLKGHIYGVISKDEAFDSEEAVKNLEAFYTPTGTHADKVTEGLFKIFKEKSAKKNKTLLFNLIQGYQSFIAGKERMQAHEVKMRAAHAVGITAQQQGVNIKIAEKTLRDASENTGESFADICQKIVEDREVNSRASMTPGIIVGVGMGMDSIKRAKSITSSMAEYETGSVAKRAVLEEYYTKCYVSLVELETLHDQLKLK